MQVLVVSAVGRGQATPFTVDPHETIRDLKRKIADAIGTPAEAIRLTYRGRELDDKLTIEAAGIEDGAKIFYITTDMVGGN